MATKPPTAEMLAEATARRLANAEASPDSLLAQEHEKRQMFRRMIDPGIFRPNSKEVAMDSLKASSGSSSSMSRSQRGFVPDLVHNRKQPPV